jgi:streptogramin lyase
VGGTLQRIDPSTGVAQVIDELDFRGVAVAVAERDLWVAVMDDYQPLAPAEVIRLDPGTGEVVARVPLPDGFGFVHRILPTSGAVWVAAMRTDDDGGVYDPSLIAIDPSTGRVVGVRPSPGGAVVTDGESLWASRYLGEGSWALTRLDGATGEVLETVPIGAERVGEVLATGTDVWFMAGDDVHATLDRLDPSTGSVEIVAELAGRGGVVDMEASPGSVWLLHLDYRDGPLSTLSRIDLP